ncbi:MAG: molybdopterin-synthase adenylyltransferase MoeB [Gemmatimonadota bacterium]|nr:molybdopterin-synthase adenylyltransferase MoeB [Gemmatimonadota bacterium]MDH4349810.1 molybdopterin-synthase adenylyltransferase MoeB [Gemmatimonadota bacterium]MDH5196443.1 molybdopterin-synthase adenylyltransferase MoeB [Gemmatimonadota bacterium]
MAGPPLTPVEMRRYARHFSLPEIGETGQRRLKAARVLLVGAGGLGSPAALYLAAGGVGVIGIVDDDRVDESNLQRQILYGTQAIGRPKGEAAEERLRDLNPHVRIERFDARLTSGNALGILREFDVIVDGSDNFPTRYLVNDACVLLGKPDVYGAIFRFEGQVSVFAHREAPCYRCLFRDPPPPELIPSCEQAGVLGVVPGIIGSLQALEVMKLATGAGQPLVGRLLLFDGLLARFRELPIRRDPACPVCGDHPTIRELIDYDAFCGTPAPLADEVEITVASLRQLLAESRAVQLVDVREPWEWSICRLDGANLIPLRELPQRFGELEASRPVVAYCHTGQRSLIARQFLMAQGYGSVRSLRGGVDSWSREIDPDMPRY